MKINQLKAGVLLSYCSFALSMVIQLFYTPVMTRLLGRSDYGLYTLVASVVSNLGLLTFGTNGCYLRFYFQEKKKGAEQAVARLNATFLLIFAGLGLLAVLTGLALAGNVESVMGSKLTAAEQEKASLLLTMLAFSMGISITCSVFDSFVTAHEQYFFQRLLNVVETIMNPFLALPLMLMGLGSTAVVIASVTATVSMAAINVFFCLRKLKMRFSFQGIQGGMVKAIFGFSFFIFLNQIVDQINWNVDSFLLGRFWGTLEVAVYGLASRVNNLYLKCAVAISSVFAPRVNQIVAQEEQPNGPLMKLMVRVGRIQALILMLILLGVILLGRPFMLWMGGEEAYLGAYPVLLLLLIPVTISLVQDIGVEIQRAKNKHYFRGIMYFFMALINIAITIPLSKRFGCVGAAAGTAIALVIGNVLLMNWYYHCKLGLDMAHFWRQILSLGKGLAVPACYCIVCGKMVNIFSLVSFILTGGGLVIVYCGSMWLFAMNEDEKNLVRRMFARLNIFRKK